MVRGFKTKAVAEKYKKKVGYGKVVWVGPPKAKWYHLPRGTKSRATVKKLLTGR